MKALDMVTLLLVIIGGLNLGLVGLFHFDFIATVLGDMTLWSRIAYILVGLSAVYLIVSFGKLGKR